MQLVAEDNSFNLQTATINIIRTIPMINLISLMIAPVGSYPPNPLGLHDMMESGNEWVSDWYAEDYYKNSPEKDPQGPASGTEKVIRGYLGSMFGLYDITRGKSKPDYEGPGDGFCCVENK